MQPFATELSEHKESIKLCPSPMEEQHVQFT